MSNNRYNFYNIRYNNRVRLINSYINHVENMNREFNNILTIFRNSEQNLSRLIFEDFNDNENIEEEEETIQEDDNLMTRSASTYMLNPIRAFDYLNIRNRPINRSLNRQNNRNINVQNNRNINLENNINTDFENSPTTNPINNNINLDINTNNFGTNTETNDNFMDNFMTPIVIRPTSEQINTATVTSSYDLIQNPINTTCPISTVEFRNEDIVTKIIYCGHIFLKIELDNWFGSNTRCPLCRYDIRNFRPSSSSYI